MGKKLRQLLKGLTDRRAKQEAARDRAVTRMRARHEGQKRAEREALKAQREADRYHAAGKPARADAATAKALRLEAKADAECARAIQHKQAARRRTQTLENISTRIEDLERELAEWERTHKPKTNFKTRRVEGADDVGEAFIFAARKSVTNCSRGYWLDANRDRHARPNFYSMWNGGFDCTHELTRGQLPGTRSDCSLYVTGLAWAAGLPDPNGQNWAAGFTGTLLANAERKGGGWRFCTLSELRAKGWGLVVYGSGTGHHVEAYIGEGKSDLTAGHGSAPVDYGTIHLFGLGEVERYIIFDPR